jgi:pyrimidine deaminase RibD-like protein
MIDQDSTYMERALELARKGAGLVSPNPMVGAVLVKGGKIVGEGYHRYDGLKHAESHAIDMAGENARGATLYCSLEPCSHYGRTAPCTTALIEAGISRAFVSIKDPNPLVNGNGISELRAAGIVVEVGLCHQEALQLNECYFRFISSGRPFVHGIIEYPNPALGGPWIPSASFLQVASDYDALILGFRPELNSIVASARLNRERHRRFVVLGTQEMLKSLKASLDRDRSEDINEIVLASSTLSRSDVIDPSRQDAEGSSPLTPIFSVQSDCESLLDTLGRLDVTSVIALPGIFDAGNRRHFTQLDRLTLVVSGTENDEVSMSTLSFGEVEFNLEDVTVSRANGYTEFSGDPHLRGVA